MADAHFEEFCSATLPRMLHEGCGVEEPLANAIGADIRSRGEAFARLDPISQGVLAASFVEDVVEYQPAEVSSRMKAATAVVVRNSLLEQVHAAGAVNDARIEAITTSGARALAEFLGTDHDQADEPSRDDPFADLSAKFPRAWAALSALATAVVSGGRVTARQVQAPVPSWPGPDEVLTADRAESNSKVVIRSGIEPSMDDRLVEMLREGVASRDSAFIVPSLSRISRNSSVLHHAIELLLARDGQIITTNYWIRPSEVWARRGRLLVPDVTRPTSGFEELRGLSGRHRKTVESVAHSLLALPQD